MTKEYLLDTCVVIEIFRGEEQTKKWVEDNHDMVMYISGWTVLELLKNQKNKGDMENCLKRLISQFKIVWTKPEYSDELPTLLINHFHSKRDKESHIQGNAIFDALIYTTGKSNNLSIVTRNGKDFAFSNDVEILDLQKIEDGKYKLKELEKYFDSKKD